MKKILFLIVVVVILAAMAVPAFADRINTEVPQPGPAVRWHVVFDDYPLVYCGDDIGVGDFWLYDHEEADAFIKDRLDKDGNLIQRNEHVDGTDMIYREGNTDKVLNGTYHINQRTNWEPPSTEEDDPISGQWVGIFWNINIPGHGVVFHESANYTYPEDRQEGLSVYDEETLCKYFAS